MREKANLELKRSLWYLHIHHAMGREIQKVPETAMRDISKKTIIKLTWLWGLIALAAQVVPAEAQVAHQSGASSSEAWVSHQMNQPPPGTGDRYDVSPDRLDEIRQLYMQAKQEYESKKDIKAQDKKQ
jgi:hypothetical protein